MLVGVSQEKASVWRSWPAKGQEKARHPHMEWAPPDGVPKLNYGKMFHRRRANGVPDGFRRGFAPRYSDIAVNRIVPARAALARASTSRCLTGRGRDPAAFSLGGTAAQGEVLLEPLPVAVPVRPDVPASAPSR